MNRINLRAIWNTARSEFIKWVTNPRIIIVGVMLVFIKGFAVTPLLERAEQYGESLNVLESFIAVCQSSILVMFMPCVFLLLICDFPIMGGNTLFFISRTGRLNWFLGQVLFMIMSIFSYIGFILVSCMVMSKGVFSGSWSDSITKFDAVYPENAGGVASELLPSNLYNQMSITTAFLLITFLLAMYLFLLAMILCVMKMLYLRSVGLFATITVIAFGVTACALRIQSMWYFPMANTIVWLHYKELLREPIIPVSDSFIYFITINTAILLVNFTVLQRLQFINIEQEDS